MLRKTGRCVRPIQRYLIWGLILALICVTAIQLAPRAEASALAKGKALPMVTLEDWEGNEVTLAPREGRNLYIFYWDEYFGLDFPNIGRAVLNALEILADEYDAIGVDFVAVTASSHVKDYIQMMDYKFPVLLDSQGVLRSWFSGYAVGAIGVDKNQVVKGIDYYFALPARNTVIKMRQNLNAIFVPGSKPLDVQPSLLPVGSNVPVFKLPDYESNLFDTTTLVSERPVCYILWHDKCSMAVSTMLRLRNLFAEYNARGIEFVSIAYDHTSALDIQTWLASNFLPFIHLKDPFAVVADSFGAYGVPTMIVTDASGKITFSGAGDKIHNTDLRAVLEAVAGPPLPGGWPGQPGSDPLHNLEPLKTVTGNFDGLKVYNDPLLEERVALLATGLRTILDELYPIFDLDTTAFTGVEAAMTFYADAMRYFNDSSAPCTSIGYCVMDLGEPQKIRMYIQWVTDLDTTLMVARHELIHGLLKLRIKQVPPLWFDEGCADAFSRPHLPDYHTVTRYMQQKPSPAQLEKMWQDENQMGDAREIGHAVVAYILHSNGQEGFSSLLAELAKGKTFEQAVSDGLGLSINQLWAGFWTDVPSAQKRAWDAETYTCYFDDVDYDTYGSVIDLVNKLAEIGVVSPFGNFLPKAVLTRSQFVALTINALGLPIDLLTDLNRPDEEITRSEAAAVISLALGLNISSPPEDWDYFADQDNLPAWAEEYVWTSVKYSVLDRNLLLVTEEFKNEDSPLYIDQTVNRLEATVWIIRAYHLRQTILEPPVVTTLNVALPQDPDTPPQEPGTGDPNGDSDSEGMPWMWLLTGLGLLLILGGAAAFILKQRSDKKAA